MNNGVIYLLMKILRSSGIKRLSAINRFTTTMKYKSLDGRHKEFLNNLLSIIDRSHSGWDKYDYGEGFLYQSFPRLYLGGLRDTKYRFEFYRLASYLGKDKTVLDIGCNSGFISLMIADHCKRVDGIEYNPYLIEIANLCKDFISISNAEFECTGFEEFSPKASYDIVLSLANHHTFDKGLRPEFADYIREIRNMIITGGLLILESHPYEFRQTSFIENVESISDLFEIIDKQETRSYKSALDNDRLVVWLRAK